MVNVSGNYDEALTWVEYYESQEDDGGMYEELFRESTVSLTDRTIQHLEDPEAFTQTVSGNAGGTMLITPSRTGYITMLHHGFPFVANDEFNVGFIQGNLRDSSTFKYINRDEVTEQVKFGEAKRTATLNCPTTEAMLSAETPEAFASLTADGNDILNQAPNHCLISPPIFVMAGGAGTTPARELACKLIEKVRPHIEDSEVTSRKKKALSDGFELILAFLWAAEKGKLKALTLHDVPDVPRVNQIIRTTKAKLDPEPTDRPARREGDEDYVRNAEAWALSSQSIVRELNMIHESRKEEKNKKEENSSLFKNLGPSQRLLFTKLSTPTMDAEPVISEFMTGLMTAKAPQKAIGLLKAETRDWEGTFSDGCLHRFLSNGFLSIEANRANPGGFTVFMFHPKTIEMGTKHFDQDTATLREYFDLDVTDSTIAYYAKKGYFHPTNVHDLRVQLQTAKEFLELVTCPNSIVTHGLEYILEPKRWRRISTIIHDRFQAERSFGSKFVYSVDRTLQNFLDRVATSWDDLEEDGDAFYLRHKARDLIEKVEDGISLNISLPKSLLAGSEGTKEPEAKKPKRSASPSQTGERGKTVSFSSSTSEVHLNEDAHPSWKIPVTTNFLGLFKDRNPATRAWPRFGDPRLPKKNRKIRIAPLCARFQMTGRCTRGCNLSHVNPGKMSETEFQSVDKIMMEVKADRVPS